MDPVHSHPSGPPTPPPDRRQFLAKACTVAVGGAAFLPPLIGGVAIALDPLRRTSGSAAGFVPITSLDALPNDGVPRKFTVFADRVDAWNKYLRAPIGAIYLRRTGESEVTALHSSCPHAGCFVDYVPANSNFFCPCHNSAFALDGTIETPTSPAARPLDALEVEIRNEREVWVRFQNFRTGTGEKIPV